MVNPVEQKYDYLGRMQTITFDDGEVINYRYNHGGQIESVTGTRSGTNFNYVTEIGYDEFAQRVYIEYGSGIRTRYTYNPYRRWLDNIQTGSSYNETEFQNIIYEFDKVGNLTKYTNNTRGHSTTQEYTYDGLYQLTEAQGNSKSHPYGSVNSPDYTTTYRQTYQFDIIGNMATKTSTNNVSIPDSIGDALNYNLDYQYINGTHKASRIGNRYYSYDQNGNVIAERDGSHATAPDIYRPYYYDGDIYSTDYGFGVVRPQGNVPNDGVYQRNYRWNERNLLTESSDSAYTVNYRYGADGQRALKHVVNNNITTLYFNKMWTKSSIRENWLQSKHIYLGEERIATKFNVGNNTNTADEQRRIYYYHTDHLGSAQTITNWEGVLHERLEYTPYGELWINYIADTAPQDATPFRFTGQELDKETGLYYYGARYLDPRTSRWMSTDPAMYQGDYIPGAPANDEARKRNGNLPGMGGVYNYVNLHVYHYAGNNPIKYVDPDGNVILSFEAHFLMTDYPDTLLGNSQSVYISKAGCYITTFANIGLELKNRRLCGSNYGSVEKSSVLGINSMKNIFLNDSAFLAGRDKSMNTIFGVGRWDWFTKAGQANKGGLLARLEEFQNCSQGYMIMGIFDLSSLDPKLKTHMVGITGLPGEDGVFNPSNIVPSSINDRYRLLDPAKASAYNMNTLMELRILKTDDERR